MGQRNGLSPTDILKINAMYECNGKTGGNRTDKGTENGA